MSKSVAVTLDYEVKLERVAVRGGADLEIRSLLDRQQYADPDGAAAAAGISSASWPMFGQVWPAARVLADLMQSWDLESSRVLEIGCGLGLASLVVHRRRADVTASDHHPLAETFLRDNLRRNSLPPMKYAIGNWAYANPWLGEFDLIIGSDVLYERDHSHQLAGFINRHAAAHADVIIIDPDRGNRAGFARCLQRSGFDAAHNEICASRAAEPENRARLLRYQR